MDDIRIGTVLMTTVPASAKGGIAALHGVLMEARKDYACRLVYLGSGAPFSEGITSRLLRIINQYGLFFRALAGTPNANIVHVNTAPDQKALARDLPLVLLSKVLRKKVVLQVHGTLSEPIAMRPFRILVSLAFRLSDAVLVFSEKEKMKLVAKKVNPLKIAVFPNAVKVVDFATGDCSFRETYRIPKENFVILFTGRMVREKGIFDILESASLTLPNHNNVTFVFAGDGPALEPLMKRCRERKLERWVRFTGNLEYGELIKAYDSADIFLMPSHSEGMPMSILEALASGIPIISTPVGAVSEILNDRINGFFVPVESPAQIVARISALINDDCLRSQIKRHNRELAKREFDVEVVVSRLSALYSSLL